MRRNAGLAIAAVVAVAALVGMIVIVVGTRGSSDARVPFGEATAAAAPFAGFGAARLSVGGRCLRVLVAATAAQRARGLRDVQSLAPYDGMLFVNRGDTDTRFTMAKTRLPLDITWYEAGGEPVGHAQMAPCPAGSDATCPTYASPRRYRYALERHAGATGGGTLSACA